MCDLERVGLVKEGDVRKVVVGIVEYMKEKTPNLLDMYTKGDRVMLTSKGLCITDRQNIGDLKKYDNIQTIIEVLTVYELYEFMSEFKSYIEGGQGSAVLTIMEYKLKEKMDDLYEDNYDVIFSKLEIKGA